MVTMRLNPPFQAEDIVSLLRPRELGGVQQAKLMGNDLFWPRRSARRAGSTTDIDETSRRTAGIRLRSV